MFSPQPDFETAQSAHRETVHDLRNLFTVIVSARRLLGKDRASQRGEDLLAAIEDAAFRGSQLTTNLLARDAQAQAKIIDVGSRLAGVAPLLLALADPWVEVRVAASDRSLPACLAPETFDAAILELVRNARAAIAGKGAISVRVRALGDRIWLTVADTGRGMSPLDLQDAPHAFRTASANGTGLGRVQHLAGQAGGHVRIRSRAGKGTVISIVLPMSPIAAVALSAAPQRPGFQGDLH